MLNSQELSGVKIIRSIESLHPKMIGPIRRLSAYLFDSYETKRTQFLFNVYETFRTPHRQAYLITKGTTKAGPWESAHGYGLGVDFVPYLTAEEAAALGVAPGWYWPPPEDPIWVYLGKAAAELGLQRPISWDKPHVQHPLFAKVMGVLR